VAGGVSNPAAKTDAIMLRSYLSSGQGPRQAKNPLVNGDWWLRLWITLTLRHPWEARQ
jgi:hypothetical protein